MEDNDLLRTGLVIHGHSFVYSCDIGRITLLHRATRWIPHCVQSLIVTVFNNITCFLFGHQPFGPIDEPDFHIDKTCPHCCKKWKES